MTEQEIVNILKDNMSKGIAYLFLPEDVWDWIGENLNDPKLMYLASNGQWRLFSETDFDDYDNIVFALPDYYQVKEETKGKWVEFEIDQRGRFTDYNVDDDDHQISFSFGWHQWSEFLDCSYEHDLGFIAFGGWQYGDGDWNTYPLIRCGEKASCGVSFSMDDKPMIPKKIRFWKESR